MNGNNILKEYGKEIFLMDDSLLNKIIKNYGIMKLESFKKIIKEIAIIKSNEIVENIRGKKNIIHVSNILSDLEIYSIGSNFNKRCIKNLQLGYRLLANLRQENFPYFYIAIPVADRDSGLDNLLTSINNEIKLFGYPKEKIIVNVFNDGEFDINIINYKKNNFKLIVWNIKDQVNFLKKNYPISLLKEIYGIFITDIDSVNLYYKGSGVIMNIARLILNKVILDKNSLVWFIDSDQDFSIITKRKHYFEIIPNAFSIFHSYSNLFKNKDIKIATGKVVGDPGFSSTQMMRTLLTDLKNIDKPILKKIADDAYFPEIKACFDFNGFAREGFHSNYYVGYPYLKYIQKNTKFFHPFYNILFGHHVTRPMIYNYTNLTIDKNGNLNKILGTGDIVWPGNLIMRKDMLKYPSHFVCSKIRLHGPIYGYLLSKKFEKIYTVNIPCFHKRVHNPLKKIQEYRTGVLYNNNYINIAPLRVKQIEGDIILSYLKNSGFCLNNEFNLEKFRSNYKDILEINLKNIDKIKQLLSEIVNKNDDDVDFLILSIKNSINSIKISKFIKFQKDIDQIIEDIKYLDLNLEKRFKIINS